MNDLDKQGMERPSREYRIPVFFVLDVFETVELSAELYSTFLTYLEECYRACSLP